MEGWLTLNDFSRRVGGIPDSFEITKLSFCFQQVKEGWLFNLLGPQKLNALEAWVNDNQPQNTYNSSLFELVVPFLVYAVWAEYIPESNVAATQTGLVTKDWQNSEQIDKDQRASMRRKYEDLATIWANRIKDFVSDSTACKPAVQLQSSPRIGKAAPRNKSAFK